MKTSQQVQELVNLFRGATITIRRLVAVEQSDGTVAHVDPDRIAMIRDLRDGRSVLSTDKDRIIVGSTADEVLATLRAAEDAPRETPTS